MKEKCVLCRQPTQWDTDTPINERLNYFECVGQLCDDCAKEPCTDICEDCKPTKKRKSFLRLILALILICPLWMIVDITRMEMHQIWWLILLTVAYISFIFILYAGTRRQN